MATIALVKNKKQRFEVTGIVLGNLWGGQEGSYPARKIKTNTRQEALEKATDMLSDGSLDSGMGFESLIGARLEVKCIETIKIKGKEYENENSETIFAGELTPEQQEFLDNCYFNM
jgi:hypothetical protein